MAMSAPCNNPILSNSKHSSMSNKNRMSSTAVSTTYKKTGVSLSKCYEMLCGRCGKRFSSKPSFNFLFLVNLE